jgi:hypothetical protein
MLRTVEIAVRQVGSKPYDPAIDDGDWNHREHSQPEYGASPNEQDRITLRLGIIFVVELSPLRPLEWHAPDSIKG